MPSHRCVLATAIATAVFSLVAPAALAHGFAGQRFFPPTIQTDDPFTADELALPTVSTFRPDGATRETDVGIDFSKELFPRFALGVSDAYTRQKSEGAPAVRGWQNVALSAKYELAISDAHEAIVAAGAEWEIGGTGSKPAGADPTSTLTPTLYFGKGFGDLPDSLPYLKPFALTGSVGAALPRGGGDRTLEWGFALEYSLPYLQSFVKDVGLRSPFKNLIPLVEFAFETPLNSRHGPTTGTINPGLLWEQKRFQLGAEAVIPANAASGSGVGVAVQVQLFIDDLLPRWFGHPVWGRRP